MANNQFRLGSLEIGDVDLSFRNPNYIECRIDPDSTVTSFPYGKTVALKDGGANDENNSILVDGRTALSSDFFGIIPRDTLGRTFAKGDRVTIVGSGTVIVLQANIAMNRGTKVTTQVADGKLVAAGTNTELA